MKQPHASNGFTLLEMLAVILIISIGLGAIAFGVSHSLESVRDRQATSDLALALRKARTQAMLTRQTVAIHFSPSRNSYVQHGQSETLLPNGMGLRMTTAASTDSAEGIIVFYPNGSSSGGNVTLERGDQSWRLDVAWLTGKVTWKDIGRP